MAKDNTYKKENAFLVLAKRMSRNKNAMFGLTLFVILVLAIIIVPIVSPYQYDKMDVMAIKQGPSSAHLFGTDDLGRDIFTRVFYGGRYSLSISIAAVLFSTAIGIVVGAIAGYFGGAADTVIMRLLDVIQAIPSMLLTIIISAALGVGIDKTIIAIAVGTIPGNVRLLRGTVMQTRENQLQYRKKNYEVCYSQQLVSVDCLCDNGRCKSDPGTGSFELHRSWRTAADS